MACAILLIPRPRDGEARAVVRRFCTSGAMLPAHVVPGLGGETIAHAFALKAGARMRTLEAALEEIDMRLVRYRVFGMACAVVLDTRPVVYSIEWGGRRIKHVVQDMLPKPLRSLYIALNQRFDQPLIVGGDTMVHSTCWINAAGNAVAGNHWPTLLGEEKSQHVRYMGFRADILAAVALRRWVDAQYPPTLRHDRGVLRVPSRALAFTAWPAELRREAEALLALDLSVITPFCYGVEEAWVRPPPPNAPEGHCTIANVDGHPTVHSASFAEPTDAAAKALASYIPMLYFALSNEGAHTAGAELVAERVRLRPGQFVIINERAMVGAALTGWPQLRASKDAITWNGTRIERAWFEGKTSEELLPVERPLLLVHNCMRAFAALRIHSHGEVQPPSAVDEEATAAAAARALEIEAIMNMVKKMDDDGVLDAEW